ncbi:MAG: hypothetical protein ACLU4N_08510, partial [Butyricimonas faecihominis]
PNYVVVMPTATGLEYTTDKGFDVIPLFMSDSTCWNELENTEIVDQEVVFNPEVGEVQKSYPLALALSRKVGEREQKIMILGDADCLSDGSLAIVVLYGQPTCLFKVVSSGFRMGGARDVRRRTLLTVNCL